MCSLNTVSSYKFHEKGNETWQTEQVGSGTMTEE